MRRKLGSAGIEVSAVGVGTWAIGGPYTRDGRPFGWGAVDDAESLRALAAAVELGITFFDTADAYGCGHSERLLGTALEPVRDDVRIATKFGRSFDERTRRIVGQAVDRDSVRCACEASLRRLRTDRVDLYQLHLGSLAPDVAADVRETLEELVREGKILGYGWSTDDVRRAAVFAEGAHCLAIQHELNLFGGSLNVLELCEEQGLTSVNRSPLAMGLLTGKYGRGDAFAADDVRSHELDLARRDAARLRLLERVREILTGDGRTLAQAAIGWLWARSDCTIPIPGFRTEAQLRENAGALAFGPLTAEQLRALEAVREEARLLTEP